MIVNLLVSFVWLNAREKDMLAKVRLLFNGHSFVFSKKGNHMTPKALWRGDMFVTFSSFPSFPITVIQLMQGVCAFVDTILLHNWLFLPLAGEYITQQNYIKKKTV